VSQSLENKLVEEQELLPAEDSLGFDSLRNELDSLELLEDEEVKLLLLLLLPLLLLFPLFPSPEDRLIGGEVTAEVEIKVQE